MITELGPIRYAVNRYSRIIEIKRVHMADGYARVSGKHGVCIGQNGPGVSNLITGVAAAYWAHSPFIVTREQIVEIVDVLEASLDACMAFAGKRS